MNVHRWDYLSKTGKRFRRDAWIWGIGYTDPTGSRRVDRGTARTERAGRRAISEVLGQS